jgi:hypothetical protein
VRCNPDLIPDGYARLSLFYDWIQQAICEMSAFPPDDCPTPVPPDNRAVLIRLYFIHDLSAEETTYAVRNKATGMIAWTGPDYVPARGDSWLSTLALLPGEYSFEVYDSFGDGLVDQFSIGGWILYSVILDDEDEETEVELATGNALFEFEDITDFTVDESSTPTGAPTEQPAVQITSDIPSGLPTLVPSDMPTSVPSDVPSLVPSDVPSLVPSYAPSLVPSDVPSLVPSDAPSLVPSGRPTNSPTDKPEPASDAPTSNDTDQPLTEAPTIT